MSGLAEIEPDAWNELLERLGCTDAYLLREYLESARVLEKGRPLLLHLADGRGGDVVFPLILRDLPTGDGFDVTTPYGYGGPVGIGLEPPMPQFWELYGDWCRANAVLTTFVRFHPLFANQRRAGPGVSVEPMGRTVGWRLREADLFEGMHAAHRRAARRAVRAGIAISVHEAPTDLSPFAALYELTMRRVGAAGFYLFSQAYWDTLARLGERLVLFVAAEGGEKLASALCFATPPWLHYHLGATADRGRELGASNLLFYEAAVWARERAYERFHLGGGVGAREDSLFTFKRRFDPGGDLLEFAVGKAVHDPDAYRALTGRAADDLEGFFPAYREGR
jgi:serine/alanine adding enzyme